MADTIEKVQVEVEATAKGVSTVFKQLESQLGTIQKAMASIDTSKLNAVAKNINTSGMSKAEKDISSSVDKIKQSLAGLKSYKDAALGGDSSSLTSFQRRIISIQSAIDVLGEKLRQVSDNRTGINIDTEQFQEYRRQLAELQSQLTGTKGEVQNAVAEMSKEKPDIDTKAVSNKLSSIKDKALSVLNAIKKVASGIGSAFASAGKGLKSIAARMLGVSGGLDKTSSSFKHGLKTLIKYGFGVRSLYVLFRRLRKAVVESFGELQKSGAMWQTTKANVEGLKTALSTLKFQFGAAFEPLFNFVAPALTSFINYLISLMNTISAFIAKLTGRSTYSKVAQVMSNTGGAAGSAGKAVKELNKQLQNFDELNNISPENNSGGGGGGGSGGTGTSATYTEESVDSALGDFANSLAEAIEKGDWYKVGNLISQKLTDAMNSIDWDKVFAGAKNFGKNLADFLNGLITPDLFSALGTTIGNAIKTKLTFLNEFAKELDWSNLGESIASGLKAFVDTHPIVLFANTFSNWAKGITEGLATAIRNLLDNGTIETISNDITEAIKKVELGEIAWNVGQIVSGLVNSIYVIVSNKETWKELGKKIGDGIDNFFKSMNQVNAKTGLTGWGSLAKSASSLASGLLEMITKAIETIDWEEVGQAIADFFKNIDWAGLAWNLVKLAEAILGALVDAIKGFLTNATWKEKIGAVIVGMIGVAKLTGITGKLKTLLDTELGSKTINTKIAGLALTVGGVVVMGADQSSENLEGLFHNEAMAALGGVMMYKGLQYLGVPVNLALRIAQIAFVWEAATEVGKYLSQSLVQDMMDEGIISSEAGQEYINISNNGGAFGINWWLDIGQSIFTGNFWDGWTNMWTDWLSPLFDEIAIGWEALLNKCKSLWSLFCDDLKSLYNMFIAPWLDPLLSWLGYDKDVTEKDVKKSGGKVASENSVDTAGDTDATYNDTKGVWDKGFKMYKHLVYDSNGNVIYGYFTGSKDIFVEEGDNVTFNGSQWGLPKVTYNKETGEVLDEGSSLLRIFNLPEQKNFTINSKITGDVNSLKGFHTLLSVLTEIKHTIETINHLKMVVKTTMTGVFKNTKEVDEGADGIRRLKGELEDTDATFTIDVAGDVNNTDEINRLSGSMGNLRKGWKDEDAKMKVYTSVDGIGNGVQSLSTLANKFKTELFDKWQGRDAKMTTSYDTTRNSKALGDLDALGIEWSKKSASANFTVTTENMSGWQSWSSYRALCDLYNNWYGTDAKFGVQFDVSGAPNIQKAFRDLTADINAKLNAAGVPGTVSVPNIQTATGGVVTAAQLRMVGEAGAEAIVPLQNNLGWLGKMSDMLISGMEQSSTLGSFVSPPNTRFATYESTGYGSNSSDYLLTELVRETARQNDILEQILDKPSGITSSEVFRAVRTEGRSFKTRTGNSPFNY